MANNNQHPTLTGSEILWATLAGEGTTTVFGYPGGAILPIYDALRKFPTIHHILVRHEQGAAHMADGYARASGRPGVCMATSGPGATNLVTGLATAMLDSIPLVAITGQVSSKVLGSDAFQEVDITGITLPITKHNFLVTRAEDIAPAVREAFQIARSGRPGPVLIDITKDAQQASAVFSFEAAAPHAYRPHPMLRAESSSIREAVELIQQAKKPIILAGHGIVESGAEKEVLAFAEAHQIPIASTLLGLGAIPAAHPLSLGMMGMHGESWVNNAIQQADLLLAFGMRFDDRVTGNLASYSPNSKKIHIEIDPSEINKNVRVDVALIGDLKEVLQLLQPLLNCHPERTLNAVKGESKDPDALSPSAAARTLSTTNAPSDWLRTINASKGTAAVRDIINLPDNGHLYAAHVINDIWHEAAAVGRLEQTIIVTDVGQHQMWEAQYFKHEAPRSLVTSGGLGTMGFALPAAIGAKVACPEKDVWVIAGDGGFQMTAAELSTIVQENLAINIAVINNGFLGMVRQWQETFYDKNYSASPILSPDFVKLADAHGIAGANVSKRSEVIPTAKHARTSGKPYLINFQVEKEDGVYPMITPGAALHEMVRRPHHDPLLETAEDE
jgi:acetolactate synthase I/II/III large subunit